MHLKLFQKNIIWYTYGNTSTNICVYLNSYIEIYDYPFGRTNCKISVNNAQ